jgi:hypothetical protein
MTRIKGVQLKISSAVKRLPADLLEEATYKLRKKVPERGDVIIGEVTSVGWHHEIEELNGRYVELFEGDLIVTVLGNRYATSEFGGKVPSSIKRRLELLNAGGVSGRFTEKNLNTSYPTVFKPLGYLINDSGKVANISDYTLPIKKIKNDVPVVLVLGSGMDAGKTTTAMSIIRALKFHGKRVRAGKITGTSRMKDINGMKDAGALDVLDHVDAGFPSTSKCSEPELEHIFKVIYSNLSRGKTDYVVLEIADGIFQRETNILLKQDYLMGRVSHIFLSASDAAAAYGAKKHLDALDIRISAFSGPVANSELMIGEVLKSTGIACVNPLIGSLEEIYNIIES